MTHLSKPAPTNVASGIL